MLIQVNRDQLLQKLQIVGRAVPVRSIIPSLSGVLLEADQGRLLITGNDLEISISTEIDCLVDESGEAVIPARLFTEAIRRSPGEQVTLRALSERNAVQIISGPMQMEILALSAEEFPETSVIAEEQHHIVPQLIAKNMIRQIYFAISREELRPILTGALWSFSAEQLKMTALDGYRLASRWVPLANAGVESKVVVPGKALRELLRLLDDSEENLDITIGGNSAAFEFNGIRLVSRLLEGQFPNIDQFIPREHQTRVMINANDLIAAVERAALVSKEGADGSVKISIDGSKLAVSAQSMDIGRHYEELDIQKTGDNLQIMYNIKALGEMLRSAESEEVMFDFHGSFGPGIVRPAGQDNYIGLLMPVRLS